MTQKVNMVNYSISFFLQLLGNEPPIDPTCRVKNDYLETITIVDPLDVQCVDGHALGVTNITYNEGPFLCELNQQAVSRALGMY